MVKGVCKIGDFGSAKELFAVTNTPVGTPIFRSRETFDIGKRQHVAVDVYAFGLVLWCLLHRCGAEQLFTALVDAGMADARCMNELPLIKSPESKLRFLLDNDIRPTMQNAKCDPFLWGLMNKCWHSSMDARPSMFQVLHSLCVVRCGAAFLLVFFVMVI
jgi:serine/threonine protein kinase